MWPGLILSTLGTTCPSGLLQAQSSTPEALEYNVSVCVLIMFAAVQKHIASYQNGASAHENKIIES